MSQDKQSQERYGEKMRSRQGGKQGYGEGNRRRRNREGRIMMQNGPRKPEKS